MHVPDLFEGRTFSTIEEGMGYAQQVGFPTLVERAARAADDLPSDIVYAGFSLGVVVAQSLAQTRPGARGALFLYSFVPPAMLGAQWPPDLPAQIHGMDADPIFVGEGDIEAARDLVAVAHPATLFLYPGDQHYFADQTLPSYDEQAAELLTRRARAFLEDLDRTR